jgi:hypothetical protein
MLDGPIRASDGGIHGLRHKAGINQQRQFALRSAVNYGDYVDRFAS